MNPRYSSHSCTSSAYALRKSPAIRLGQPLERLSVTEFLGHMENSGQECRERLVLKECRILQESKWEHTLSIEELSRFEQVYALSADAEAVRCKPARSMLEILLHPLPHTVSTSRILSTSTLNRPGIAGDLIP